MRLLPFMGRAPRNRTARALEEIAYRAPAREVRLERIASAAQQQRARAAQRARLIAELHDPATGPNRRLQIANLLNV